MVSWLIWFIFMTFSCPLANLRASPGRYYAAAVMKTLLGLLITKYDSELLDPQGPRWFVWRSFIYPRPSTKVILRRRAEM